MRVYGGNTENTLRGGMKQILLILRATGIALLVLGLPLMPVQAGKDKKAKEERKLEKAQKEREQLQLQEEQQDYYKKWLNEDVVYIINDEEKKVFNRLTNDDERDAFIEQFWSRRDPDPRTNLNEFKEEHYLRIAYANDHFYSGVEGWYSDRGRIHIMFGKPSQKESHNGGLYQRRLQDEGGGYTSVYRFERWFYDYIPGIGDGIEIEFVDASKTGEFKIALRPSEKDALWQVGTGATIEEHFGSADRSGTMLADLAMRNMGLNDGTFMRGAQPFDKVRNYFRLSKPPKVEFAHLRGNVETRLLYNPLPLEMVLGDYRVGQNAFLVPLTIRIPAHELTYDANLQDVRRATVQLYGKAQSLTGKVVYEFEDLIAADSSKGKKLKTGTTFLYQKQLPLRPGRYKLTVILEEESSKRIAIQVASVQLSKTELGSLTSSALIVADGFASSTPDQTLSDPFMTPSGIKVYPNVTQEFLPEAFLNLYAEAYEVALDQATQQPSLNARFVIMQGDKRIKTEEPKLLQLEDRVILMHTMPLKGVESGRYQIMLELHDRISGQQFVKRAPFKIQAS